MTLFNAIPFDDVAKQLSSDVCCGCAFCKGGKMREDVKHYKLFSLDEQFECYLSIDTTHNVVEIRKKL